jgi:hypothetical protein
MSSVLGSFSSSSSLDGLGVGSGAGGKFPPKLE